MALDPPDLRYPDCQGDEYIFAPPAILKCPHCDGDLTACVNVPKTGVLVECQGTCKCAFYIPLEFPEGK